MNRLAATVRVLVAVATVLTVVLMVWFMRRGNTNVATADFDKSVAVIPFALVDGDSASARLDIAGDVANVLSTAPELKLADRVAAARFRDTSVTAQELGTALNVSSVLKGTVRRAGDRVQVTAELSNAHNGVVLWSQQYDRDARALRTITDDIARSIAAQLQVTLKGGAIP